MSIVVLVNAAVTGSNLFKMEIISFFFFKMKKSSQRESQTTVYVYIGILYNMETIRVFFSFWKKKLFSFFIQKKGRVVTAKERNCCDSFHSLVFQLEWLLTDAFDDGQGHPTFFIEKIIFWTTLCWKLFFQSPLSRNGTCGGDWLENKKEKNIKIGVTCGFMCAWMCVGVYSECKCDLACKCEFHVFMFKYKCVLVSVLYCVRVNVSCGCVSYCTDVCASVCVCGGGWWMNEWKEMEGDQK